MGDKGACLSPSSSKDSILVWLSTSIDFQKSAELETKASKETEQFRLTFLNLIISEIPFDSLKLIYSWIIGDFMHESCLLILLDVCSLFGVAIIIRQMAVFLLAQGIWTRESNSEIMLLNSVDYAKAWTCMHSYIVLLVMIINVHRRKWMFWGTIWIVFRGMTCPFPGPASVYSLVHRIICLHEK